MKKIVMLLVLTFSLMFSSAYGGWMGDIRDNQNRVIDYLYALMENPNTPRPRLHPAEGWKAQRAMDEMTKAMQRAERLAQSGKPNLIQIPVFRFGPDDSGWSKE